jgi:molecular chaperone GrpE
MPDKTQPFEEFAGDDVREPLGSDAAADTDAVRPATDPVTTDTAVLSDTERQRDESYNLLLRTRADFDNYRKRVDRERQEWAGAAAADFIRDLLPLVDDLERALATEASPEGEPYRRGVELIHRQLVEMLRKRGVRPIEALGADFDPHVHQAVVHEHVPGRRDGEVVEELRRGYMLGDRLLRPAMVKVAKA